MEQEELEYKTCSVQHAPLHFNAAEEKEKRIRQARKNKNLSEVMRVCKSLWKMLNALAKRFIRCKIIKWKRILIVELLFMYVHITFCIISYRLKEIKKKEFI